MSTSGPTPPASGTAPPGSPQETAPKRPAEIKLIARSMLFYWWPVWMVAFVCAGWTFFEDNRLAVLPDGGKVEVQKQEPLTAHGKEANVPTEFKVSFPVDTWKGYDYDRAPVRDAVELSKDPNNHAWTTKVSRHPGLGVFFVFVLVLVVFTTNVPLRGLWSFVVILMIALVIVVISLVPGAWDRIFESVKQLKIYMNLAFYLFVGLSVFVLWAIAFFIFDRRQFVIFSPGQIRVCEHIGDAIEAYSTVGVQLTKQRDDPFRHLLLGFGSSDLIIKFATGDRREVRIQNVLGLNFKMEQVEDLIRTVPS